MSVMERRLQLLLDTARYERVEAEAKSSGRSVAAVIREAIDLRFDDGKALRMAAVRRLLDMTEHVEGIEPDWSETKSAIEGDIDLKLRR